jgi:hypothetical protein
MITDKVENFGSQSSPFTILYHINAGFPLLDESSELILASRNVEPYDRESEKNVKDHTRFTVPKAGFSELNFLHTMESDEEGLTAAALVNRNLAGGIGLSILFNTSSLPYLSEWKMMGEGDYVVGLEPCNTKIENRGLLRKDGRLPFIELGEIKTMEVEFGILEGEDQIEDFARQISTILKTKSRKM